MVVLGWCYHRVLAPVPAPRPPCPRQVRAVEPAGKPHPPPRQHPTPQVHRLQQGLRQRGRPLQAHHHPHRCVPLQFPGCPELFTPAVHPSLPISPPGEKPFLCDKCGRGFNRVDNLRSHVKTVHQGKAGMKILEPEDGGEVNIVTVASDEMVTLATEALAATAVTQLTGEWGGWDLSQKGGWRRPQPLALSELGVGDSSPAPQSAQNPLAPCPAPLSSPVSSQPPQHCLSLLSPHSGSCGGCRDSRRD